MSEAVEVPIPALLPHQAVDAVHPARFKVLRKGRRWGKDRMAFNVSWFGHGPDHCWPGIVDGWDVAWLAPDYPQAKTIWNEEIKPRFDGLPGVRLNEQEHSIALGAYGSLVLRSSENVTSLRGLGKRLIGVVVNEAAHLDLAYAWRQVIRPILMDNHGWAIIMSTTNRGWDGGTDEQGRRRIPSYFNQLCEEIRTGKRGPDWAEFYGTAAENPKIDPNEFAALVEEYIPGSVALEEEIYAKLLAPGTGLAFPEWDEKQHVLERFEVPAHWVFGAGFDWGYYQPSAFTVTANGQDGDIVVLYDQQWVQELTYDIGVEIGRTLRGRAWYVDFIAADSSIWGEPSKQGWANIAEELQAGINAGWGEESPPPQLLGVSKGKDSRRARATLLHHYLKVREAGPRLRFLKACMNCTGSIPRLPPSPTDPEDVDTKADDHVYDALTYYLMTRPQMAPDPVPERHVDRHPGLDERYPWLKAKLTGQEPVKVRPRFKPTGPLVRAP